MFFVFITLQESEPGKDEGYSFECIFSILISLPFVGVGNINRLTTSKPYDHMQAKRMCSIVLKTISPLAGV